MKRTHLLTLCLALGLAAVTAPAFGETYYVEEDQSSVGANLDVSFSASGFLKLVIFDPNGPLDFLNPKSDAFAGIYGTKTLPSSAGGTLDAEVAGGELALSGIDLDLLTGGPQTAMAGADIHVDAVPQAIVDLLDPFIDQINPNWVDPNDIQDILDTLLGGFDFDYDFEMTINELTMTRSGDPVTATITEGAFENLFLFADVNSEVQFNGGDPLDLPAVPLPFLLDGTYTDTPVDTLTLSSNPVSGGVDTPEIVIIDRLITIPLGAVEATFQIRLQIDAGTAQVEVTPALQALTGYLLTTAVDGNGSIDAFPAGPEYVPGSDVQLTPVPDEGWNFSHWEGDLSGSDNPATLTMDTHKSVTAVFVEDQLAVTVNTVGEGSVILDPAGGLYFPGTTVTLTPLPGFNYQFLRWEGDVAPDQTTDNPLEITVTDDLMITAVFEEQSNCGTGAGLPLAVGLVCCSIVAIRRRR